MASRFQSFSKPALFLLKSATKKPNKPVSPTLLPRPFPIRSRLPSEIGCLQSLLPLHSAVSEARLTSCLAINSWSARSLSQGMLSRADPGV